MDIHVDSTKLIEVEVWARPAALEIAYDLDNWTKLLSVKVLGRGMNRATRLPEFTSYVAMNATDVHVFS